MDLFDTIIDVKGLPPDMLPLTTHKNASGTIISAKDKTHENVLLKLHIWRHNGLFIWHWESFFECDLTVMFQHGMALAGIAAAMKGTFFYSLGKRRHATLVQGQYNLLFNTPLSYKVRFFRNRQYDAFGIYFPVNFLNGWKGNFAWVEGFIHKTSFQKAVLLRRNAFVMPPQMKTVIRDLQYCSYDGVILRMYLKTKSHELILLAFTGVMDEIIRSKTILTEHDRRLIREAIEYLQRRPAMKISPAALARAIGLNEAKLKAGFQRLYFTSPHAFHLDDRLQKACDLLMETDLEVGEIGEHVGFRSLSNFTATFKRVIGVVPTDVR
jgi:AraC family transcriptional activator of pyochelin receptor